MTGVVMYGNAISVVTSLQTEAFHFKEKIITLCLFLC